MSPQTLQNKILKLLETSSISEKKKLKVKVALPSLDDAAMKKICDALTSEQKKISKLNDKENRLKLKYEMLVNRFMKNKNN